MNMQNIQEAETAKNIHLWDDTRYMNYAVMSVEMFLWKPAKSYASLMAVIVVAIVITIDLHKSKVPHYANIINGMLVAVKLFRYCYRLVANTAILLYPNRRHLESRYTQAV